MKKLAILCAAGLDNFLAWVPRLADEYEVKIFLVKSNEDVIDGIRWGDILWCEWANEVAALVTAIVKQGSIPNKPSPLLTVSQGATYIGDKPVIVRLHSYEALYGLVERIRWDVVKKVVFVAPHMLEITKSRYAYDWDATSEVVYNGVDLNAIEFIGPEHGYHIAVVGNINNRKNPGLALQVLCSLREQSKDFTLHWAGDFQELAYEIYIKHMVKEMGLENNSHFYGHLNPDQMKDFWKDKNYLLHTSIHEGHSYAILEAMARGIPPLVHNFYGSRSLYRDPVDKGIYNTPDDLARMMWYYQSEPRRKIYRQYLIDNGWTLDNQVAQFRRIIGEVARKNNERT